jgi:hypothetical protein
VVTQITLPPKALLRDIMILRKATSVLALFSRPFGDFGCFFVEFGCFLCEFGCYLIGGPAKRAVRSGGLPGYIIIGCACPKNPMHPQYTAFRFNSFAPGQIGTGPPGPPLNGNVVAPHVPRTTSNGAGEVRLPPFRASRSSEMG